jgi:Exonuclease
MTALPQRLIFTDIEAAGSAAARHPILQVAAIAVNAAFEELETFEVKLRFEEASATKASLRKANYTRGQWAREAIHPRRAAIEFSSFLKRHATVPVLGIRGRQREVSQLVAHNAEFDNSFIQAWYERQELYYPARFQMLCTLQRAEWYFAENPEFPRPDNMKLLTLCRYFEVRLNRLEAHDALADVRATIGLYRAILKAEQITRPHRSWQSRRASRFASAS